MYEDMSYAQCEAVVRSAHKDDEYFPYLDRESMLLGVLHRSQLTMACDNRRDKWRQNFAACRSQMGAASRAYGALERAVTQSPMNGGAASTPACCSSTRGRAAAASAAACVGDSPAGWSNGSGNGSGGSGGISSGGSAGSRTRGGRPRIWPKIGSSSAAASCERRHSASLPFACEIDLACEDLNPIAFLGEQSLSDSFTRKLAHTAPRGVAPRPITARTRSKSLDSGTTSFTREQQQQQQQQWQGNGCNGGDVTALADHRSHRGTLSLVELGSASGKLVEPCRVHEDEEGADETRADEARASNQRSASTSASAPAARLAGRPAGLSVLSDRSSGVELVPVDEIDSESGSSPSSRALRVGGAGGLRPSPSSVVQCATHQTLADALEPSTVVGANGDDADAAMPGAWMDEAIPRSVWVSMGLDAAPFCVQAEAPMHLVHFYFSQLTLNCVFVVDKGRFVGMINKVDMLNERF